MKTLSLHSLEAYSYTIPEEQIATHPCEPRDHSRLLIIDRAKESFEEIPFFEIAERLPSSSTLITNNTKVIPARLFGNKKSGARIELLLVRACGDFLWEVAVRPAKKTPVGTEIHFPSGEYAIVEEELADGKRKVRFAVGSMDAFLQNQGHIPLPHYLRREETKKDRETYQTVYAKHPGAVAAPTAGLHFTEQLLQDLRQKGTHHCSVTLHVGMGTFRPVYSDDIRDHQMHKEWFAIEPDAADWLSKPQTRSSHLCVGTTTCRALETAFQMGNVQAGSFETDLFIHPGYQFRYVQSLLTNFHLPRSSLLMLVCAFGGYELIMEAYRKAALDRFRFYSYGDAMWIV